MNPRSLLTNLTIIFLAILSWQLRWVLLVFFGAIVISVALDVLIQKLGRQINLPRSISLAIVLLILLFAGSLIFLLVVPELLTQVKQLGALLPTVIAKIRSIMASQPSLIGLQQSIPEQISWDRIQPVGSKLLGFAGGAANSIIQLILICLLAILMAIDPEAHRRILLQAMPKTYRQPIAELLDDFRLALGGWLTGMTISATTVFIITWAGLSLLKVPLALLSSIVCGIFTFVPTIGPSIATMLPLSVALIISPTLMLEVLIFRLAIQNIEAFILTPILLSRTVNLLPTIALLSQLSLGALLGLPGVLLALPLAVVLQVGIKKIVVIQIMDQW